MRLSLIQVYKETDGLVEGVWLQDYTGDLDGAKEKAKQTEKANGNRIKVAVVEQLTYSCSDYSMRSNLKRL
ncbi:hypothetical protein [Priestia aryabhattai]